LPTTRRTRDETYHCGKPILKPLNSKPSTRNPKPYTLNPKPYTPKTLNPKALNPEP